MIYCVYRQTDTVYHTLHNLTLADEGSYSCAAKSDAGNGKGGTFLDVTDPAPYIHPTLNVTVAPDAQATLDCVVESNVTVDVRWHRVSAYSGKL